MHITSTSTAVTFAAAIVVLAPAGLAVSGAADPGADASPAPAADTYVVGFYEMPEDRTEYQGAPVVDVDRRLDFLVVDPSDAEAFQDRARTDDQVRYVEPNHHDYELHFTPNDPQYPNQYGPQITNTESAWDTTLGSTSVKLGLLDTGITTDHEDFVNDRVSGYDYVHDDQTFDDAGGTCGYHGSHVTGTAAATTDNGKGIAGMSESSIIMHKIFDDDLLVCLAASTDDIADALADLGDKGAHISSNSWGGGDDQAILDAIDYANSKGVIHVAAAGNDGECEDCISEPWKSRPKKVVIVTCSDSNDDFCSFSSQGPEADVIAPGNDVLSVDGSGTTDYTEKSGTSMSTPHVAGAVGLYIAANGDVSHSTMEDEIAASAEDIGLSAERQGHGRLDSGALVGGGGGDSNSAPTASFTYDCSQLNCSFDASDSSDSDGSIESYDWEFGDGTTGVGEFVNHTYDESGTYTVNLTVTDDDGATDTESQDVTVSSETMHVHDIQHSATGPHLDVDVLVYDSNEDPVADATVTAETCNGNDNCQTWTATTDNAGVASFKWKHAGSGTYTTCVQDVTHDTLTWDSSQDHADDGSCETGSI